MQSNRRLQSAIDTDGAIWRGRDPNYPGVPQPPEVLARSTSRATVDYETYVLAYAAQQRGHALLLTAGVVVVIGAAFYLSPPWLIIAVAVGLGLAFGGATGYGTARDAHRSYTRHLAVSVSETYERAQPAPPPATVRPFVESSGNGQRTTNTGRLNFPPDVWRSLFDLALANGGMVNRDAVAKRAGIGRQWYYGEGYGRLLEELTRLGFLDNRNRLTPAALQWYAEEIPLPLAALPARPRNGRTDGGRTGAAGANGTEWGES